MSHQRLNLPLTIADRAIQTALSHTFRTIRDWSRYVDQLLDTTEDRVTDTEDRLTDTETVADGAQQRSTLTTKGDLYVATGNATTDRLPVGADGTIPVADSAKTLGIGWETPASVAVDSITLTDDQAAFLSFPGLRHGIVLVSPNLASGGTAVVRFRSGSNAEAAGITLTGTVNIAAALGELSGNTGADGALNIRARINFNRLYLENRTGASKTYFLAFISFNDSLGDGTWTIV